MGIVMAMSFTFWTFYSQKFYTVCRTSFRSLLYMKKQVEYLVKSCKKPKVCRYVRYEMSTTLLRNAVGVQWVPKCLLILWNSSLLDDLEMTEKTLNHGLCNSCLIVFTVYGICTARGLYVLQRVEPEEVYTA